MGWCVLGVLTFVQRLRAMSIWESVPESVQEWATGAAKRPDHRPIVLYIKEWEGEERRGVSLGEVRGLTF